MPRDPRDFLRGQYIDLAYEFSRLTPAIASVSSADGAPAWVVLAPDGEFHTPSRVETTPPARLQKEEVALRGRMEEGRLTFGIERYFVPEGSPTPDPRDITVRLRVGGDGSPRIEQVLVKGVPWP